MDEKPRENGHEETLLMKDMMSDTAPNDEKPEEDRKSWAHQSEYLLSCIGFAVGLGNVWRFPYMCQTNGGGAFIVPYFIMLVIAGLPLFYLETTIGQRLRCGPIPLWKKVSPYAVGVGFAMCMASILLALFYNVIIAWCLFYFFSSWQSPLPWKSCPVISTGNTTGSHPACQAIGSASYYFYYEALEVGENLDDRSGLSWKITLCLLAMWVIVVLSMIKGITVSGKVVYFTALFPYCVLLIFFVRGLTLEGMEDGVAAMFKTDWSKMMDPMVWLRAAAQIFFSLSIGFGGLMAYASYNPIHENTLRDSLIITMTNCGTSIFAGVAIFAVLGFRANNKMKACLLELPSAINTSFASYPGVLTSEVREEIKTNLTALCDKQKFLEENSAGTGLAFVAMMEAVNEIPGSVFFSIVFFLMMITLGLDSMYGSMEGIVTSLRDIPWIRERVREELVVVIVAVPSFFVGLIFTQYSGEYVLQVFNSFAVDYTLLSIAIAECIFLIYFYNIHQLTADISYMNGKLTKKLSKIFWPFWTVITPGACIAILLATAALTAQGGWPQYTVFNRESYGPEKIPYPGWAYGVGVIICLLGVLPIPLGILHGVITRSSRHAKQYGLPTKSVEKANEEMVPITNGTNGYDHTAPEKTV